MALPVSVISDFCDQVATFQEAFIAETSLKRFQGAFSWTMFEVAKEAGRGVTEVIEDTYQPVMHSHHARWTEEATKTSPA